uniref:NADH dehydrogenase [ubiquinone] 1 alpha subcomplex subunit 1 n=1 Tax=Panagrellus redivivus TaxID=6233 RepID=A0A7E4VT48_PANRE
MQSLYPLFWTILLEMAYNVGTVIFVGSMALLNKGDNYFGFDTGRRTNFIKKMDQQKQDEHNLYFKQLKEQW